MPADEVKKESEDAQAVISPEDVEFALRSPKLAANLRRACQTDLFFLANRILRNPRELSLSRTVHGEICNLLLPKDPDIPLEQWSPVKERVVLAFRGALKTTINAADVVQMILCYPNIRILLMSGKLELAKSLLDLVRRHFERNEVLHLLFPTWCKNIRQEAFVFNCPARTQNFRDPTLSVATADSVKAGGHYNVLKLDDFTNEISCSTPDMVAKSVQQYDDLQPLLEPGGYIDFFGTRWALNDLPEVLKQRSKESFEEFGETTMLYREFPVWELDSAVREREPLALEEREKMGMLLPSDVSIAWPEKMSPRFLFKQYRSNKAKFYAQYLLRPDEFSVTTFSLDMLQSATRPFSEIPPPHLCHVFSNWDLAGVTGQGDYTCGVTGIVDEKGKLYIVDLAVRRFRSAREICDAVAAMCSRWNPETVRIEDSLGARYLEGELVQASIRFSTEIPTIWGRVDHRKGAKSQRILQLASALHNGALAFSAASPHIEQMYEQFCNFGRARARSQHDDIPDSVAQLYVTFCSPSSSLFVGPSSPPVVRQASGRIDWGELAIKPQKDDSEIQRRYADFDRLTAFQMPSTDTSTPLVR